MLEHRAEKAKRARFRQIKVLHQDYSSWKINHNKLAAAEDFSVIQTMIASISTSKRHKGFLQLSLDASRRLSAFLSITLKVPVQRGSLLVNQRGDVSSRICGGQHHLRNWLHYKDEQSRSSKISRQTDREKKRKKKYRQKVGRINWCRDECAHAGLCVVFLFALNVRLFSAQLRGGDVVTMMCADSSRIYIILTAHSAFYNQRNHHHHQTAPQIISVISVVAPDWSCALRIAASRAVGGQHDPNISAQTL